MVDKPAYGDLEDANQDEQEGKSLDELAGEGRIAGHDETVTNWLTAFQGRSVKEMLENTPEGIQAKYDPDSQSLTIIPISQTEEEIMKPADFKTGIFGMRGDIELVKSKVKNWMGHPEAEVRLDIDGAPENRDCGEMVANLELTYRHLEDARMRLGKAVQAYDGGKSCYPR